MYLGFSVVGLIFLIFTLPETKGKDLEEIEGIFATPWFSQQGSFQPFNKKEARFNYVHIDESSGGATGNSSSSTIAEHSQPSQPSTSRPPRPSRRPTPRTAISRLDSSSEEVINTRLCTNRQMSTDDDLDRESDDST